jgi:hypothetical protein
MPLCMLRAAQCCTLHRALSAWSSDVLRRISSSSRQSCAAHDGNTDSACHGCTAATAVNAVAYLLYIDGAIERRVRVHLALHTERRHRRRHVGIAPGLGLRLRAAHDLRQRSNHLRRLRRRRLRAPAGRRCRHRRCRVRSPVLSLNGDRRRIRTGPGARQPRRGMRRNGAVHARAWLRDVRSGGDTRDGNGMRCRGDRPGLAPLCTGGTARGVQRATRSIRRPMMYPGLSVPFPSCTLTVRTCAYGAHVRRTVEVPLRRRSDAPALRRDQRPAASRARSPQSQSANIINDIINEALEAPAARHWAGRADGTRRAYRWNAGMPCCKKRMKSATQPPLRLGLRHARARRHTCERQPLLSLGAGHHVLHAPPPLFERRVGHVGGEEPQLLPNAADHVAPNSRNSMAASPLVLSA